VAKIFCAGVREGVVVPVVTENRTNTPPLKFRVMEGVVHAIIIPVSFISLWHPVVIVVKINSYKTLSVKKEWNKKRKENSPVAQEMHQ
jgi:hypothetical protein